MAYRMILALLTGFDFLQSYLVHSFEVTDATIASSLNALQSGDITCVNFIQSHIDRINAFDKEGPALTSITSMEGDRALALA